MKKNLFWAFLGALLLGVGVVDIIFYWPDGGTFWFFLIRKLLYILAGSFLIWDHLIEPMRSKSHYID